MFVKQEAVLSSQIEGTQASLSDIIEAEAQLVDKGRPSDVKEVSNYISAINEGVEKLAEWPVSTRLITHLHRILMNDVRGQDQTPGEFRRSQNWIGPAGCSLNDAIFVPPPYSEIDRALGQLENFLNNQDDVPFLIRAGLVHAQFETIHPFLDGNGRMGRMLITLMMVERKILSLPILYLSYFFKQHRVEYYGRLQAVREDGDWENWLIFFLNGVTAVARLATETARNVVALREEHRQKIIDGFDRSAAMPLRLLDRLYGLPIIDVNMTTEYLDTSFPTANKIIARFVEIGILTELTGQRRNRVYYYHAYLRQFEEI